MSEFNSDLADSLSILDSRRKYLSQYGYKLAESGQFGLDVPILDALDINETEMSVVFPFADGKRRDGVGDLLEIGGIRTERHKSNPLILFDHGKNVQMPIALAEDPRTKEYTVFLDPANQVATCKAFFYQCKDCSDYNHALFCEQLFDLVCKRYVRAGSIGFTVVNARELQPNYETGTPKGLHLLAVNMLEASIVVMPANQDTVRKALSLPRVCGKPLSPVLVKSLSPYAGDRKASLCVGGKKTLPESKIVAFVAEQNDIKESPDYGYLYLNDADDKVWYVTADGNSEEFARGVFVGLENIVGQGHVTVEAEVSPKKEDGWRRVEVKEMVSIPDVKSLDAMEEQAKQEAQKSKLPHVREGMRVCKGCGKRYYTIEKANSCCGSGYTSLRSKSVPVPLTGNLSETNVPPAKWKPGVGAEKDIGELRRKYRKTKNLRRRVKRSSPGSSVVYLRGKDLKAAEDMAKAKGVKFARIGVKNDLEKVRLSGDDDSIDEVAKQFGRPVRGVKSMAVANKITKTEDAKLVNRKDLDGNPAAEDPIDEVPEDDVALDNEMDDVPQEKYSAQVGRRVHEDFRTLMADYDRMKGPLENEDFANYMQETLEHFEDRLSTLESLWGKHHGDLPGLDGAMAKDDEGMEDVGDGDDSGTDDKDVDTEETGAVPADSVPDEPEDDTSDEEVADAMMEKRLKALPAIRKKYSKKNCGCGVKAKSIKLKTPQKTHPGPCKGDQKEKALTEGEVDEIKEDIDTQAADTEDNPAPMNADDKGLKDHEVPVAREASQFLKELGDAQQFDDEMRMKSFHYHKALEFPGQDVPPGSKGIDGNSDDQWRKEMDDPTCEKMHPHRKMCKDAGGFLRRLAYEKAFGDPHRQEALQHHKNMEGMLQGYGKAAPEEETPEQGMDEMTPTQGEEVGAIQEKRLNRLEAALSRIATLV